MQALQKRLDQLEAKAKVTEETNDRQTDQIAQATQQRRQLGAELHLEG